MVESEVTWMLGMRAAPIYFGPRERPTFGWLHRGASGASSRVGLVIVNPFGYEAICAHRSLRHFADAAAAAGVTVLRFDLDGTGDSAGSDRDPGRVAAWIASAGHAADALRAAGSQKIAFLGLRLGALIAARAAAARDDVDSLVAIAPVIAGKAYLRELRALHLAQVPLPPPDGVAVENGVGEAIGFAITAETKAALEKIDLVKDERPPAPAVLLIERDDLPGADAWPARLTAQGVAVDRYRLPGYVEMMLAAQETVVPEKMVRAVAAWLGARAGAAAAAGGPVSLPPAVASWDGLVERAEFLDERLFGVLSTPGTPARRRRGLLLLNAGAVPRIGPNRLYVLLARRWARLGHAVLRMDMAGIGDSLPRAGEPENVVYTAAAKEDVAAGLAFLKKEPGVTHVTALGICSGGYDAFKAAVAGVPLDGVLLINPLTFFYKPGMSLDPLAPHKVSDTTTYYRGRLRSLEAWKKLLRGDADVREASEAFARHTGNVLRDRARSVARRFGVRLGDDLELELNLVCKKGIALHFLFAARDPGVALLKNQGGGTVDELRRAGRLGIDVIEGPDHTFTPLWSHALLVELLGAQLDGPPPK